LICIIFALNDDWAWTSFAKLFKQIVLAHNKTHWKLSIELDMTHLIKLKKVSPLQNSNKVRLDLNTLSFISNYTQRFFLFTHNFLYYFIFFFTYFYTLFVLCFLYLCIYITKVFKWVSEWVSERLDNKCLFAPDVGSF
jgi:hypothetical protein